MSCSLSDRPIVFAKLLLCYVTQYEVLNNFGIMWGWIENTCVVTSICLRNALIFESPGDFVFQNTAVFILNLKLKASRIFSK